MNRNRHATHHILAEAGEIADTVIMVGDPVRAEKFANMYLDNPRLICNIRLINIWTGKYKGNDVTIMAHGMGFSSIGIYVHELFEFFNVERIVRLGSAATYDANIKQGDIIIGNKYWTYSTYGEGYGVDPDEPINASEDLIKQFENVFQNEKNINYKVGGIYASEWFYAPAFFGEGVKKDSNIAKLIESKEIIGKEMEGYVLQLIANHFGKQAITVVTVIDNLTTKEFSSADNKISTDKMGEIALKALWK